MRRQSLRPLARALAAAFGGLLCTAATADPVTIVAIAANAGALALGATKVVAALAAIGAAAVVGDYQRRKAQARARRRFNAAQTDRLLTLDIAVDNPKRRIYGQARVAGAVVFKAPFGPDNRYYRVLVSLAGHQCHAVDALWLNDTQVTVDANGYVQTAPWAQTTRSTRNRSVAAFAGPNYVNIGEVPVAGSVVVYLRIGGDFEQQAVAATVNAGTVTFDAPGAGDATIVWQRDTVTPYARLRAYLGGPTQDLSATLAADHPGIIVAADKFAGDCLLDCVFEYSQDAMPGGMPTPSALVRGLRLFDPRTGATAYTENLALCARDWSLYEHGGRLATEQLDDASFIAAANACDTSAALPMPGGTVVVPAYYGGIAVDLDDSDPTLTLDAMLEGMAGQRAWSAGRLRIAAGAWRAPVATITGAWVSDLAPRGAQPAGPLSEHFNAIRPRFIDPAQGWTSVPGPVVAPASYATADGGGLPRTVEFEAVNDLARVQHLAGIMLRQQRQTLQVTIGCNLRAALLEPLDVVALDLPHFGWSGKTFEVQSTAFALSGAIELRLREISAATFAPGADFSDLGYTDNSSLPSPHVVAAPQGLSAAVTMVRTADDVWRPRLDVSWTLHPAAPVRNGGRIELRWRRVSTLGTAGPEDGWTLTTHPGDQTRAELHDVPSAEVMLVQARAATALARSPWGLQIAVRIVAAPVANLFLNGSGLADPRSAVPAVHWTDGDVRSHAAAGLPAPWGGVALRFSSRDSYAGDVFPVTPGDIYEVEFDSLPDGGGTSPWDFRAGLRTQTDAVGAGSAWTGANRSGALSGHQVTRGTVQIPAGARYARLWAGLTQPHGGSAVYYASRLYLRRLAGFADLVQGSAQQPLSVEIPTLDATYEATAGEMTPGVALSKPFTRASLEITNNTPDPIVVRVEFSGNYEWLSVGSGVSQAAVFAGGPIYAGSPTPESDWNHSFVAVMPTTQPRAEFAAVKEVQILPGRRFVARLQAVITFNTPGSCTIRHRGWVLRLLGVIR